MTVRTSTLSVTYGAFSLTLEGFDDPFATMRDVAEYFRTELAADRGFGNQATASRITSLRRAAEGRASELGARPAGIPIRAKNGEQGRPRILPDGDTLFDEDAPPTGAPTLAADTSGDPLSKALDAERADGLAPDDDRIDLDTPDPPRTARRGSLPSGTDEAAVDRLISQTDSALAGPEAQRRHATFAQLKAAVAATRAENDAGGLRRPPGQTAAEIARYRDDLVQSAGSEARAPRRPGRPLDAPATDAPAPVIATPETTRLAMPLPSRSDAPLILAAEQRVAGNGATEKRPQRAGGATPRSRIPVALTMDALFDEGARSEAPTEQGFARFLVEVSPRDLPAVIDAASAYLSHVEGLEDFPRVHLMRLLEGNAKAQDREAVMRSIGVLLREGKLRRSRRGQFEAGAQSEFSDAARRFRRKN